MRKIALLGCLALGACNANQLATAESDIAKVSAAVSTACADVNAAAALAAPFGAIPQVGAILTFATASCVGANAVSGMVAKAAADPATVAWLQNLAAQIRALTPRA